MKEEDLDNFFEERFRNHRICANCGVKETKKKRLLQCLRCEVALYCDRNCQTAHWPSHKDECKEISSLFNKKPDERHDLVGIRLLSFVERFRPVLKHLDSLILFEENGTWIGDTHAVVYWLENLPEDCKFPRLRIRSTSTRPLSHLSPAQMDTMTGFRRKLGPKKKLGFTILQALCPGGATSSMSYLAKTEFHEAFDDIPLERGDSYRSAHAKMVERINEIARGDRTLPGKPTSK